MGHFFLGAIGIACSFLLIKYREGIGNAFGDPEWAHKIGGIYNVIILCGAIGFFWSIAYMTNTLDIFFAPILSFFPQKTVGGGVPMDGF